MYTVYMLTLIIGKKNEQYQKIRNDFFAEHKNIYRIGNHEMNHESIVGFAKTDSLFGESSSYFVPHIATELLMDVVYDMSMSTSNFFVTTEKLLAPEKKILEKKLLSVPVHQYQITDLIAEKPIVGLSAFTIANALPVRDRKKLWTTLMQLKYTGGESAESVHGILFWKCKDMIAKNTKIPNRAVIINDMRQLVHGYHVNRIQGGDLWNWLEQWVLQVK